MMPGWPWPRDRISGQSYTREELARYVDRSGSEATLSRSLDEAGFVKSEMSTSSDGKTGKGRAVAHVFDSASERTEPLSRFARTAVGQRTRPNGSTSPTPESRRSARSRGRCAETGDRRR